MPRKKKPPRLDNLGSLIAHNDRGKETCLGYLFHFPGRGVYDAKHGKVDVLPDQANTRDKLLDQALINGIDDHCEVGQGNKFYVIDGQIKTWLRTLIAPALKRRGRRYVFVRGGKEFRATKSLEDDDSTVWVEHIS
jgi:hypothetical protein